jgi:hypothetical protein
MVPPLLDQEPKPRKRGQWLALLGLVLVIIAVIVLLILR